MHYDTFHSPYGLITISTDGTSLTGLHLEGDRYFTGIPAGWTRDAVSPVLRQAQAQLAEYFAGRRRSFDLPLAPAGTPFQRQVWQALGHVAPGTTATYSHIAQAIGRPQAARAVGTAIGRNPICIVVPCHRVLAAGGGWGGYVAGVEVKRRLLSLEGAAVPPPPPRVTERAEDNRP